MKTSLNNNLLVLAVILTLLEAKAGNHSWTGNGVTGNWSEAANWQANNGPLPGETNVELNFPAGAVKANSTNDLDGLTVSQLLFGGTHFVLNGTNALTFSASSGDCIRAEHLIGRKFFFRRD